MHKRERSEVGVWLLIYGAMAVALCFRIINSLRMVWRVRKQLWGAFWRYTVMSVIGIGMCQVFFVVVVMMVFPIKLFGPRGLPGLVWNQVGFWWCFTTFVGFFVVFGLYLTVQWYCRKGSLVRSGMIDQVTIEDL